MAANKPYSRYQDTPDETTVASSGLEDSAATASRDTLGFKPYVDAVFSFLHHEATKPPFTISVEGEWGTGKSSFMLQLEEALRSQGELTMSFNAWRHDRVESMWSQFALQLVGKLSQSKPWYFRIWSYVRFYFKSFDFVKGLPSLLFKILLTGFYVYLIYLTYLLLKPGNIGILLRPFTDEETRTEDLFQIIQVVGWSGLIIVGVFVVKQIAMVLGNPLTIDLKKYDRTPDYSKNSAFIEAFHEDIDKTLDILVGKRNKVFIFIDDLDRAEVPKAAELMQGLNMMISNSDKFIFIIGMDREKVAAGIAARYKDLLVFLNPEQMSLDTAGGVQQAIRFGYNFLEKFIQLSFKVPAPSAETIKEFLRSLSMKKNNDNEPTPPKIIPSFRLSVGEDSAEFTETVELVAPYLHNNPRRLKQFINAFRLKAHIAYNTGLFEHDLNLNLGKLGKFVAMQLRWPHFVDAVNAHPELVQELTAVGDAGFDEGLPELVKKWYEVDLVEFLNAFPAERDLGDYDLGSLDIKLLLETSAKVSFDEDTADGSTANQKAASFSSAEQTLQ